MSANSSYGRAVDNRALATGDRQRRKRRFGGVADYDYNRHASVAGGAAREVRRPSRGH
jgi:hypothetical protein